MCYHRCGSSLCHTCASSSTSQIAHHLQLGHSISKLRFLALMDCHNFFLLYLFETLRIRKNMGKKTAKNGRDLHFWREKGGLYLLLICFIIDVFYCSFIVFFFDLSIANTVQNHQTNKKRAKSH